MEILEEVDLLIFSFSEQVDEQFKSYQRMIDCRANGSDVLFIVV